MRAYTPASRRLMYRMTTTYGACRASRDLSSWSIQTLHHWFQSKLLSNLMAWKTLLTRRRHLRWLCRSNSLSRWDSLPLLTRTSAWWIQKQLNKARILAAGARMSTLDSYKPSRCTALTTTRSYKITWGQGPSSRSVLTSRSTSWPSPTSWVKSLQLSRLLS